LGVNAAFLACLHLFSTSAGAVASADWVWGSVLILVCLSSQPVLVLLHQPAGSQAESSACPHIISTSAGAAASAGWVWDSILTLVCLSSQPVLVLLHQPVG
jgi:hypothetical protein